jgi:hypothetical protein
MQKLINLFLQMQKLINLFLQMQKLINLFLQMHQLALAQIVQNRFQCFPGV